MKLKSAKQAYDAIHLPYMIEHEIYLRDRIKFYLKKKKITVDNLLRGYDDEGKKLNRPKTKMDSEYEITYDEAFERFNNYIDHTKDRNENNETYKEMCGKLGISTSVSLGELEKIYAWKILCQKARVPVYGVKGKPANIAEEKRQKIAQATDAICTDEADEEIAIQNLENYEKEEERIFWEESANASNVTMQILADHVELLNRLTDIDKGLILCFAVLNDTAITAVNEKIKKELEMSSFQQEDTICTLLEKKKGYVLSNKLEDKDILRTKFWNTYMCGFRKGSFAHLEELAEGLQSFDTSRWDCLLLAHKFMLYAGNDESIENKILDFIDVMLETETFRR